MIVADICLIFHLFNKTDLTIGAQEILKIDPHWIFPPLWKEEYASILSKLVRKGFHSVEEVVQHFNTTVDELKESEVIVNTKRLSRCEFSERIWEVFG